MPEYRGPSVQIPAEQLETLLDRRAEQQARPRPTPRDVLAVWMGNALAGLGAGIVVGVGMLAFGQPLWPNVAQWAGGVAGVLTGVLMVWRNTEDEATARLSNRKVRRTVEQIRSEAAQRVAQRERQLSAAYDVIEELERTVNQLEHRLNLVTVELGNARRSAQPANWVRPVEVTAQDEQDARAIIHHRHSTGAHLSRRQAVENKGWTQARHKSALKLLEQAGVVRGDSTQPTYMHTDPHDSTVFRLADALAALDAHLIAARSKEPPVMPPPAHYVEDYDE